jgi:hypothetical protein
LFLGGIALAQFLAFHDVRLQRDASRADASLRLDSVRYRFVLEALDGHAALGSKAGEEPRPGYQFVLTFANAGLEPMYYKVESMTISMGGFTADPAEVFSSDDGIILPGRSVLFHYHWISAPLDLDAPLPLGTGDYDVIYGHPSGGTRFRTRHRFQIAWTIRPGQPPETRWTTEGTVSHDIAAHSEPLALGAP